MLVHAYPRVEEPAPKLKRSSNSPSVLRLSGLKRKRD